MSKLDDIKIKVYYHGQGTYDEPLDADAKLQIKALFLELIDFQPCEPNCTGKRHAYHQGQWDLAQRIEKKVEEL